MDLSEELLAYGDLRTEEVDVPVWNRKLTIQELGLQDSLVLADSVKQTESGEWKADAINMARVVALGVIDANGERVFKDAQVPTLARKSRKAVLFLYNRIMALSGSIEDAEKN